MSQILDALKKADEQRKLGHPPKLENTNFSTLVKVNKKQSIAKNKLLVLLIILLIVLVIYFFGLPKFGNKTKNVNHSQVAVVANKNQNANDVNEIQGNAVAQNNGDKTKKVKALDASSAKKNNATDLKLPKSSFKTNELDELSSDKVSVTNSN